MPPSAAKACAVRPVFARVVGKLLGTEKVFQWQRIIRSLPKNFLNTLGPLIHKNKGFSRNSHGKVHPNFAKNLGREILGNTFFSPNAGGIRSKILFEGPLKQVLVQGHNLRLLDEVWEVGHHQHPDKKTRTVSTCLILDGPVRANRFADSRESFRGSRPEPLLLRMELGGGGGLKIANRKFEAIRANRSHVMKIGVVLRIDSRESGAI